MLATRAVVTGVALLLAAGAARALPVETTTDLNLRAGPGAAYPALATMPAGEIVHVDVCVGGWCRLFYRGYPGWASERHLARIPGRPFPWEGAGRAREPWPFDEPYVEPFRGPYAAPFEEPFVEPFDDPYVVPFDGPFEGPSEGPYVEPFVEPLEPFAEPFREVPDIVEVPEAPRAPAPRVRPQAPRAGDDVEEPGRLAVIVPLPPRAPDRSPAPAPIGEPQARSEARDDDAAAPAPQAAAPRRPEPAPLYRAGPAGAGGRDVL